MANVDETRPRAAVKGLARLYDVAASFGAQPGRDIWLSER